MKRAIVVAGVALAVVLLVPASPAYAQWECGDEQEEYGCSVDYHRAPENPEGEYWNGHDECRYCIGGGNCHPSGCIPPMPDPEGVAAYEAVIAAAAAGDLDSVVQNGRLVPSFVLFNEPRHSIQIVGCAGGVIANLPVPTEAPATLVSDLRELATLGEKLSLSDRER